MQLSCHAYVINLLSREIVKRAGAVWDSTKKVWFVHAGHDLRSVQKVLFTFVFHYFNIQKVCCLMSGLLLTDHFCKTFIRAVMNQQWILPAQVQSLGLHKNNEGVEMEIRVGEEGRSAMVGGWNQAGSRSS